MLTENRLSTVSSKQKKALEQKYNCLSKIINERLSLPNEIKRKFNQNRMNEVKFKKKKVRSNNNKISNKNIETRANYNQISSKNCTVLEKTTNYIPKNNQTNTKSKIENSTLIPHQNNSQNDKNSQKQKSEITVLRINLTHGKDIFNNANLTNSSNPIIPSTFSFFDAPNLPSTSESKGSTSGSIDTFLSKTLLNKLNPNNVFNRNSKENWTNSHQFLTINNLSNTQNMQTSKNQIEAKSNRISIINKDKLSSFITFQKNEKSQKNCCFDKDKENYIDKFSLKINNDAPKSDNSKLIKITNNNLTNKILTLKQLIPSNIIKNQTEQRKVDLNYPSQKMTPSILSNSSSVFPLNLNNNEPEEKSNNFCGNKGIINHPNQCLSKKEGKCMSNNRISPLTGRQNQCIKDYIRQVILN